MAERIQDEAQHRITLVVAGGYGIKALTKLVVGLVLRSAPMVSDGIKTIFDICEHAFTVWAGKQARKVDVENYPLGRGPLIDIVGVIIAFGAVSLGLTCIGDGTVRILQNLGRALHVAESLPLWLRDVLLPAQEGPNSSGIVSGLLMIACAAVTVLVSLFEQRKATATGLGELVAEARSLRYDATLEAGLATGFLVSGWLIPLTWSTPLILCGLGAFLLLSAGDDLVKGCRNLMNPGLDHATRIGLEEAVSRRLPAKCSVEAPLLAYRRGDDLFVMGTIAVDTDLLSAADVIVERTRNQVIEYLREQALAVHAQFTPKGVSTPNLLQHEWDLIIKDVWGNEQEPALRDAFELVKRGRPGEALQRVRELVPNGISSRHLAMWIRAESILRIKGAGSEEAQHILESVGTLPPDESSLPSAGILGSWALICATDATQGHPQKKPQLDRFRKCVEEALAAHTEWPPLVRAECAFAVGHSWQNGPDFNVNTTKQWFRRAEELYIQSGIRSESDRLKTSWGHLLTLLYELGDAVVLLEESRAVREQKNDVTGQSFVFGCLGDAYSRLGQFDRADQCYQKDLQCCQDEGLTYPLGGVLCKQGEARIRRGLIESRTDLVQAGMDRCKDARERDDGTRPEVVFFATKGLAKGYLGSAVLTPELTEDYHSLLRSASQMVNSLDPHTPYQKAFRDRLCGRLAGLLDRPDDAVLSLQSAERTFAMMRNSYGDETSSLQAIVCRIEAALFKCQGAHQKGLSASEELQALSKFMAPLGGLLGSARTLIDEYVRQWKQFHDGHRSPSKKPPASLWKLIWFLEG